MPARFDLTEEEFEQRYPNIAKLPPEQKERLFRAIVWRTDWNALLARLDRMDAVERPVMLDEVETPQ